MYVCNFILGRVCVCVCWVFLAYRRWGDLFCYLAIPPHTPGFCSDAASHAHGKVAWVQLMIIHGIFQPKKNMSHFFGGVGERVFLSKEFEKASPSERRA